MLAAAGRGFSISHKRRQRAFRSSGQGKRTRVDDLTDMEIDYDAPAELFIPKRGRRHSINYRRFDTAAEAIRFAVEEFPAVRTLGAWMQVGDRRYDSDEICRLYESIGYPLRRARVDFGPA
jgi:hypothetical protein